MSRERIDPKVLEQIIDGQQKMIAANYVRIEELVVHNRLNKAFTEGRSYTNLVMAVGYAGYFALLNFSKTTYLQAQWMSQ